MLEELRDLIRSTVPGVEEEGMGYGVPFYKHHGEFVGFAAFKNRVGFGFGYHVIPAGDRAALEADGYKPERSRCRSGSTRTCRRTRYGRSSRRRRG